MTRLDRFYEIVVYVVRLVPSCIIAAAYNATVRLFAAIRIYEKL